MERKYGDLFYDPLDLYTKAFDVNPGGSLTGYGTYLGHIERYRGLKIGLAKLVSEAVAMGCPIPPRAYQLLSLSPPTKPLYK